MSGISTNYTSFIGSSLSSWFSTDKNETAGTSSDSDTLYNLLKKNSGLRQYDLPTNSQGQVYIPTIDALDTTQSPKSKLSLAKSIAEAVLIQADASSRTGNATRVEDITAQAESVMNAISDAVTDLTENTDGSISATTDALAAYKKTLAATLNSLNEALTEVRNLSGKASPEVKDNLTETLKELDAIGASVAQKAGVSWTSITGNRNYTVAGYSVSENTTGLSSIKSLVDLLA